MENKFSLAPLSFSYPLKNNHLFNKKYHKKIKYFIYKIVLQKRNENNEKIHEITCNLCKHIWIITFLFLILSLKNVYFQFHQCSTTLKHKVKFVRWAPSFSTLSSKTCVYLSNRQCNRQLLTFKDYMFETKYNRQTPNELWF